MNLINCKCYGFLLNANFASPKRINNNSGVEHHQSMQVSYHLFTSCGLFLIILDSQRPAILRVNLDSRLEHLASTNFALYMSHCFAYSIYLFIPLSSIRCAILKLKWKIYPNKKWHCQNHHFSFLKIQRREFMQFYLIWTITDIPEIIIL